MTILHVRLYTPLATTETAERSGVAQLSCCLGILPLSRRAALRVPERCLATQPRVCFSEPAFFFSRSIRTQDTWHP